MNLVGRGGRGESVWLGWFQSVVLRRFSEIANARGDKARSTRWAARAKALVASIEASAWDGLWYRRAYFDDGSPLGSAASTQCRIDSIAQSWAVLSGCADPHRAATAMDSAFQHLYLPKAELFALLAPPFDSPHPSPGYIAGYPPGVRENGGQYSHAAVWSLMALAELNRAEDMAAVMQALNPAHRADSAHTAATYRLEPYAIAGDVYACPPHTGRGGWSWYTGAAGWFHRALLESVLGVRIRATSLELKPCLPPQWDRCEVRYRTEDCDYSILIERAPASARLPTDGVRVSVRLDGEDQPSPRLRLLRDGNHHEVHVLVH
jgi:cyclic beta-1,2-glucan synthetase